MKFSRGKEGNETFPSTIHFIFQAKSDPIANFPISKGKISNGMSEVREMDRV
jgi:hypothetical protein